MNYIVKDGVIYRKGTLAHFLDEREISIGEPDKNCLPKEINPFWLVYKNLLQNNCEIIILLHSEMQYPSSLLSLVKDLVPAGQAILFYIDVDDVQTEFSLTGETEITGGVVGKVVENVPLVVKCSVTGSPLEAICDE